MADDLQLVVSIDIPKSVGNINGQIDQLANMVKKLELEVELKGLDKIATKLNSFDKAESAIKGVGKAMSSVNTDAKQLGTSFKSIGNNDHVFDGLSAQIKEVSVDSKNLSKTYETLGQNIKSEMKSIGLVAEDMKFTELKDGQNNLKQLEAQFTSTTGVVKKFRYSMSEGGKLQLVDVKTTSNVEEFSRRINKLKTEIESYRSVLGNTKTDTLLSGLENGSRGIQETTQQLKKLVASAKDVDQVTHAMQKLENSFHAGKIDGNQFERLSASLKDGSLAISDFSNALAKSQTTHANQTQSINQEISLNRQRIQAYNQLKSVLNNMGDSVPKDTFATNTIKDAIRLTNELSNTTGKSAGEVKQLVAEYRNIISPLRDIQTATKKNDLLGDISKQVAKIDQIKASLRELGAVQKFDDGIVEGFRDMDQAAEKTEAQLKRSLSSIKQVATQAGKELSQALKMENFGKTLDNSALKAGGGLQQFQKMMSSGNIAGVKEFISNISGMEAQTVKLKTAMTSTGEPVKQLAVGFKSSGQEMKNITYTMDTVTGSGLKLRAGMEELSFNANRNLSVWEQLKVAMSRFGTWTIAQEGIQGVSRALKAMVTDLLETDRQLTDIKRVISDGIDIDILQKGSMDMATNLGNNFHDVLGAVGEVSRAYGEFNEQQILAVARTATLMSNVSDISADEAITSLIGTMKAFNIEAQDSIKIVDAWNEVDNQFAISTEQISTAFEKSGSTAKTFGVSMEENLGNITAIGEVTQETGQVIGNSLKTIYSRITTLEPAKKMLKSVGVEIQEVKDGLVVNRGANDILGDLAKKWHLLSSAQQQNIGVQIAGRNQLSRFLALMSNWETATKATSTALNSSGSAMRENQAYLDSYEAKINKMKNTFSALGQTVGNAFLKAGLDVGISAVTSLMEALDSLVSKFGALPALAGVVTPIMLAFTGLKKNILELAGKGWISGITGSIKNIGSNVDSAFNKAGQSAVQFKQKIQDMKGIKLDLNTQPVKTSFKQLATDATNAGRTMDVSFKRSSSSIKNLDGSFATTTGKVKVFASSADTAGKSFTLAMGKTELAGQKVTKVMKTSSDSMKGISKGVATATGSMSKLGSLSAIASAGVSALGVALKGLLISTAVGAAMMAIGYGIEKLVSHFQKAKQEQEAFKKSQSDMVSTYRQNGEGLNDLINKYEELHSRWGDFSEAVDSGKLSESLNPDAYQEYSSVMDQLANKMPAMVEYTDQQGRAHMKATEEMRKYVEEAKKLAQTESEMAKKKFDNKMDNHYEKLQGAMEKYRNSLKETKIAEEQLAAAKGKEESLDDLSKRLGNRDQAMRAYMLSAGNIEKASKRVKEAEKDKAAAIKAANEEISATAKDLKSYGNTLVESSKYADQMGSATKAMIQDFSTNASSELFKIKLPDSSTSDLKRFENEFKSTTESIQQSTEHMAKSTEVAFASFMSSAKLDQTPFNDIQKKTEEVKAQFESFVKVIPESMKSLDSVGDGTFDKLMAGSKELISVQEKFKSGATGYDEVRSKLESMGFSTQDAVQYMRNLGQEAGNVDAQAGLLASTTDELASGMDSLKDSANSALDAFTELSGISGDNMGALTSYFETLDGANAIYGENAKNTEAYQNAIQGLAQMFNVSTTAVEGNVDKYRQMSEVLKGIDQDGLKAGDTAKALGEMSGESADLATRAFQRMKDEGVGLTDALQIELDLLPSFKEAMQGIADIDFGNPKDQIASLVEAFVTGKSSYTDFSNSMKQLGVDMDANGSSFDGLKAKFQDLGQQLIDTATKTGDVKGAFSQLKDDFNSQMESIGIPENVRSMIIGQIDQIVQESGGSLSKLKEKFSDVASSLNSTPIKVTADATDAEAKIEQAKQAKENLTKDHAKIPVTATTEEAKAKIKEVESAKENLTKGHAKIPVSAETSDADAKLGSVKTKADELNNKETKVKAGADTSQAESGLNKVKQDADELSGKEVDITAQLNLTSGWENNKAQLENAIKYMEENNKKEITVEGKSIGLDTLKSNLDNVESGIKNAQSSADGLQNIQQVVADTTGNVVQLGDTIKQQMQTIAEGMSSIGDSAANMSGVTDALNSLLDPLQNIHQGISEAKTGITKSLDDVTTKAQSVGNQMNAFSNVVSTIGDSAGTGANQINTLSSALEKTASSSGVAQNNISNFSSSMMSVGVGITIAAASLEQLNQSMTQLGTVGTIAGIMFTSSMTSLGTTISGMSSSITSSFSNLSATVSSATSTISGSLNSMSGIFSSFSANATSSALLAGASWSMGANMINGSLSSLTGTLSSVTSSMSSVAGSASALSGSLISISGAVAAATGALQSFIGVTMSVGASGASAASQYVGAMLSIAGAVLATTAAVSSGFSSMASTVSSAASSCISSLQNMTATMSSIASQAMSSAVATGSAWMVGAAMVAGASGMIIASLSGVIGTLGAVTAAANTAVAAISGISGAVAGAMGSISSFLASADAVSAKASQIKSAVASANAAKAAAKEKSYDGDIGELIDVMKTAIRSGDPSSYSNIAVADNSTGALSALGIDVSSISESTNIGISGRLVSKDEKKELDTPYDLPTATWGRGSGRMYAGINKLLGQMEAKLKGINKLSSKWRGTMDVIQKQSQARYNLLKKERDMAQIQMGHAQKELATLPALNKQNDAQRKRYNDLQKWYDTLLETQSSLSIELEQLSVEIKQNTFDIFESFIDEIVEKYEKAITVLQNRINDYDFELEVLSYIDSDNLVKQLNLLKKKQQDQLKVQAHYANLQSQMQAQYNSAVKQYGVNDERTLHVQELLTKAKEDYQSITLEVLKNEKEIVDIRSDVADKSTDKLREYYENMKSMALEAIKKEQDALKKAQETKNKLYDEEIQKIKDVYSAKLEQIDKEKDQREYDEKMSELTGDRDDLIKQIAMTERDTSLAGKKKLADLKKQLEEQNKAIADAERDRQEQLLKEQLEFERDKQTEIIEKQKEAEENALDKKLEELDEKSAKEELHYDNILNNDEYWTNLKDQIINGDLSAITNAMKAMYSNLDKMGKGSFDGLISGFSSFSKEAQNSIKELYNMMIKNMQFGNGTNILDLLNQMNKGQSGYNPTDGTGKKQNSLGTPVWMTDNKGYSPDNYLTSSGTAPAPSNSSTSGSKGTSGKPIVGGTYVIKVDCGAYFTSSDAKDHKNRLGTVKKGNYWIYNIYLGMINVTNKNGAMGSWINPADNKGGLDANGATIKSSEVNGKIVADDASQLPPHKRSVRDFISSDARIGESNLSSSDLYGTRSGFNMSMAGISGKLINTQSRLTTRETEDLLNSSSFAKIFKLPSLLSPDVNGLANATHNMNIVTEGDINVSIPVKNFNGAKKDRENLVNQVNTAIAEGLKRKGKKLFDKR